MLSVFSRQSFVEKCASTDCIWSAPQIFRMDPEHGRCRKWNIFWEDRVASELQWGMFISFLIYWCMWRLTPCLETACYCAFLDCAVWEVGCAEPISAPLPPSDVLGQWTRRARGGGNWYCTDLLNFYFPCCCHWGYHRHWTPFLLTAFVRFWETLLFASRLPC